MADMFENVTSLGRTMMGKGHHAHPEGMPTRAQMGVLFMITHQSAQGIKQIAEKFQITPSAATQLVDGLVADGLLTRKADDQDRRKISVELTAKGKEKMELAQKMRFEKMNKMFEVLSDEELMQLNSIFLKIIDRL